MKLTKLCSNLGSNSFQQQKINFNAKNCVQYNYLQNEIRIIIHFTVYVEYLLSF